MFQPELRAIARLVWKVLMLLLNGSAVIGSQNPE